MEQSVIHIAVACHKPSRLPHNPCLVPVQVNAARAAKRMDMAHDDDGINISLKNPEYCELTAQYWEWKNVEADYYGLCHYRRFLCFTVPGNAKYNERYQIEAEAIDDFNLSRFGLEDEALMRELIESNDVVTGPQQDVSKLFTPRGNQVTAYKHWTAHHRALIMTADLKNMLEILDSIAPAIGKDTREYLNGKFFSGFNCFVMKKALFQQLCEIEFNVLAQLEQYVDLSPYCTQLSRIYGFMGEIISSGFIYHLKKEGYKVKHVPLVYFNVTDPGKKLSPDNGTIPVLFYLTYDKPELFAVTWQSFLSSKKPDTCYSVIICHNNMSDTVQNLLLSMAKEAENISVSFLNGDSLRRTVAERLQLEYGDGRLPLMPFLPYFLDKYSEMVFLTDRILVKSAIDELWEVNIAEGKIVAAAKEAYMLARINDIYPETEFDYIRKQMKDPYAYCSMSAIKIDLDAYREKYTLQQCAGFLRNNFRELRNDEEIINVAFEGYIQPIDQKWCVWYNSCSYLEEALPYAPRIVYQELLAARKSPGVVKYLAQDPYVANYTKLSHLFWTIASLTPMYHYCLLYSCQIMSEQSTDGKVSLVDKVFGKGTKIRAFFSRMLPKGSRRHRFIKKILSILHLV